MAGIWLAVRRGVVAFVVKLFRWCFSCGKELLRGGGMLLRRDGWLRGTALRDKMRGLSSGGAVIRKVRRALVFVVALAVAFWLGAVYSSSSQSPQNRQASSDNAHPSLSSSPPDVESLDNEVRGLAMAQIAHSLENEQLRAQLALRNAEVTKLTDENRDLVNDILRRDETILTYRQIIGATGGDMVIHALAEDPGFSSGRRRLSAVLVRAKSGKFKGAYYFEVFATEGGVEKALRAPPKPAKLEFERYREIVETIDIPDDTRIVKMRLIITDAKNNTIASDELLFGNGEENGGGNNENNNGGEDNNGDADDDDVNAPADGVE